MKKYWIIIAAVIAAAALAIAFWPSKSHAPENQQPVVSEPVSQPVDEPVSEIINAESGCLEAGGTVTTASCCESAEDFPGNCAIGACGCAPEYSHSVKICNCGEGKCFDGKKCVDEGQFR